MSRLLDLSGLSRLKLFNSSQMEQVRGMKIVVLTMLLLTGAVFVWRFANTTSRFQQPEVEMYQSAFCDSLVVPGDEVCPVLESGKTRMKQCHDESNAFLAFTRWMAILDILMTSFIAVVVAVYKPGTAADGVSRSSQKPDGLRRKLIAAVSIVALIATMSAPLSLHLNDEARTCRAEAIQLKNAIDKAYGSLHRAGDIQVAFEIINELQSTIQDCDCGN